MPKDSDIAGRTKAGRGLAWGQLSARLSLDRGLSGRSNKKIIRKLKNYFSVSEDLAQLHYSFDARKLVKGLDGAGSMSANPFNTIAEAETWVKGRFQEMMQQNAGQIYQANPGLFSSFQVPSTGTSVNINNVMQFFSEINIDHPIFSFIKIE